MVISNIVLHTDNARTAGSQVAEMLLPGWQALAKQMGARATIPGRFKTVCTVINILHMHHNAAESHANRPCPRTYAVLFLNAWDSLQRLKWRQLLCSYAVLQGPVDAPCGEYSQSGHARRLALTVGGKHPRAFAGAAAERAHLLRLSGRRANLVRRQQPHGRCDTLLIHLLFTFCSVTIAYYLCPCGCR